MWDTANGENKERAEQILYYVCYKIVTTTVNGIAMMVIGITNDNMWFFPYTKQFSNNPTQF